MEPRSGGRNTNAWQQPCGIKIVQVILFSFHDTVLGTTMTHHIKEFTVHDYKGIHELTLKDIAPINILTGDNNSGKTSLLELLATTDQPSKLRNWVAGTRIEPSKSFLGYYRISSYFSALYYLFPCNQEDDKNISYKWTDIENQEHKLEMRGVIINDQLPESELRRLNGFLERLEKKDDENNEVFIDVQGIKLTITHNGEIILEETIYDKQRRLPVPETSYKDSEIVYISPVEHETTNIYLNTVLKNTVTYSTLIKMLNYFDKDITGMSAIRSEEISSIVNYQILSNSHKQTLPLNAYGDGMKKAVLLLSALINAQDGILLIDEFETGIHTSCMDKVFTLLLENALKLNVR